MRRCDLAVALRDCRTDRLQNGRAPATCRRSKVTSMTRMDRKGLAIAFALLFALAASESASALSITNLSGFDTLSYQLRSSDLNLSGWSYEGTGSKRYTSYLFGMWWNSV